MAESKIKVLALDLDGTLTNHEKKITPRTKAALRAAQEQGVLLVLASGRPTVGIRSVAEELDLYHNGGCILAYNGGVVVECKSGKTLYRKELPAEFVPRLCAFAAEQDVAILTYDTNGIVTERPDDPWVYKESFTCAIPANGVDNLAEYVDYPICKMLIALDPARLEGVLRAGVARFAGQIDLYPSCAFFIEAVPLGVAKDASLVALLDTLGLTRENLMAIGDGMNDRSMIELAGVGVAMQNAAEGVKAVADYVTEADNDHDGVAEAVEKFILGTV